VRLRRFGQRITLIDFDLHLPGADYPEQFSAERARFAADSLHLLEKAFRLGQIDLPTRLRAENESFDADLALSRARLETGRARSRHQQAYGLLP